MLIEQHLHRTVKGNIAPGTKINTNDENNTVICIWTA